MRIIVLFCFVSGFVQPIPLLLALHNIELYRIILYCIMLYHIILYRIMLYRIMLYHIGAEKLGYPENFSLLGYLEVL